MRYICEIESCGRKHEAKGFCSKHYERFRLYGDPLFTKIPPHGEVRKFYETVVLPYEGDECLIWPYGKQRGYAAISVGRKSFSVHRMVCEEKNGPPPTPNHQAAHSCGNGHLACVTKRHLSWKTQAENMADKLLHGTDSRGVNNPNSKLTETQVKEIFSVKGKEHQRETAKRFGIVLTTVSAIQTGQTWSWLTGAGGAA